MIITDRDGVYRDTEATHCGRLACTIPFWHAHNDLLSVRFKVDE